MDGIDAWLGKKKTRAAIKDQVQESTQKNGGSALPPETSERGSGNLLICEASFEVLTELWQTDGHIRPTLILDPPADSTNVSGGAHTTLLAKFLGKLCPEHHQAFHSRPPF
jgi:hypothetical protein